MKDKSGKVPFGVTLAYAAPAVGAGYMYLLLALYVLKFSTDVLLIAPAAMGIIYSISRIWDAISDPLAGYLSDRTSFKFGRRKTWILVSIVPISIAFYAVFSPPENLEGFGLTLWMGIAIIGFYTAMTFFFVPHLALGAELSENYHERSRLFGVRHFAYTLGSIISLITLTFLLRQEFGDGGDVRSLASSQALIAIVVMAILVLFAVSRLKENSAYQGRVNKNPFIAFRDIWQNKHARLLIVVTFIEYIGSAAIAVLTLHVSQYVVGTPQLAPLFILAYMVPSSLSVPMWLPLAKRYGKIKVWLFGMVLTGLSFGGMVFLPFLDSELIKIILITTLAASAGLAAGCGGTIGPSVQGDVIDYDEYLTGERKEGSYFAAWNFVHKGALGVMLFLTGIVLEWSGYVPNVEQTMNVQIAMISLYGLLPLVCYSIGAFLFTKFELDESFHARISKELKARAAGRE